MVMDEKVSSATADVRLAFLNAEVDMRGQQMLEEFAKDINTLLGVLDEPQNCSGERLRYVLRNGPSVKVIVAMAAEHIIGMITVSIMPGLDDDLPLVSKLAVLPEFQRRGVGTELIAKAAEFAASRTSMKSWALCPPTRRDGHRRFRKAGFENRPAYYLVQR
jgi:GNAT superfamily N-acetyltransferase